MRFGKPQHYRPVCIRGRHGFLGGPAGYELTDDPTAGPIELPDGPIVAAWRRGEITLAQARDALDREENQ